MTEYKRLTVKGEDWFDSKLEDAEVYDRLAELEDKIENGTLKEEKTCVYQEYNDYHDWSYWECSNCKEPFCFNNECTPEENQYHYCPNCGARITEHRELKND